MLLLVLMLLAVTAVCGAVLSQRAPAASTGLLLVPADAPEVATADAWRAAAIDASADAKELRLAIVRSLDSYDRQGRETVLRSALERTRGPVPVRLSL